MNFQKSEANRSRRYVLSPHKADWAATGMVAKSARGQLNKGKNHIFLSPFAPANQVSRDGFGHPVLHQPLILHTQAESSIWSNTSLRASVIPPAFPDGIHPYSQAPSGQSRVYRVTQTRTDGIHRQELAGTGPAVLKVVQVTGAVYSGNPTDGPIFVRLSFPMPSIGTSGHV